MKLIQLICLVLSLYPSCAEAQVDTVELNNTNLYGSFLYFPQRSCCFTKGKTKQGQRFQAPAVLDSIMYNTDTIDQGNQYYFLSVSNSEGQIIFEGDFFDEYPCGKIRVYHYNGNVRYEGDYELFRLKKKKRRCGKGQNAIFEYLESKKVGLWSYYDPSGKLIKTKKYS